MKSNLRNVIGVSLSACLLMSCSIQPRLYTAVWENDASSVNILLANGADANERYNDHTPLMIAAARGEIEIVRSLLANGADVNATNRDGQTALFSAVHGEIEIVRLLLANGADVNATGRDGWTALLAAVNGKFLDNNDYEIVLALIKNGADVNAASTWGATPLMLAVKGGNREIVQALLDNGADVNAKTADGETILQIIEHPYVYVKKEIVSLLLAKGAIVTSSKKIKKYLLDASKSGNTAIVNNMLSQGADINIKDDNGKTPLMLSIENNHRDIAQGLIDKGADDNAKDNNGQTALLLAVENDNRGIVKALIEKGVDVNVKDADGWTVSTMVEKRLGWLVIGLSPKLRRIYFEVQRVQSPDYEKNLTEIHLLLKQGVDPNAVRIAGWKAHETNTGTRELPGGGIAIHSTAKEGFPGVPVPGDHEGMSLLEYSKVNHLTEAYSLLKSFGAK